MYPHRSKTSVYFIFFYKMLRWPTELPHKTTAHQLLSTHVLELSIAPKNAPAYQKLSKHRIYMLCRTLMYSHLRSLRKVFSPRP